MEDARMRNQLFHLATPDSKTVHYGRLSFHVRHHQGLRARRRGHHSGQYYNSTPAAYGLTRCKKGLKEPYDWDEYAPMYFPKAEELTKIAEEAEKNGEKEKASEYYLYGYASYHEFRGTDSHKPSLSTLQDIPLSYTSIRQAEIRMEGGKRGLLQRRRVSPTY